VGARGVRACVQYLGGKSRLAKQIAAIVNAERGTRRFWEPFCGGLSISVQLAEHGPGTVSDACAPLANLYRAVLGGWDPPASLSEDEYCAARALPDSDPLKAFAGFGCSFGGKWFGGYARSSGRNFADITRRALLRDVPKLSECDVGCVDFLSVVPRTDGNLVIYCDPPYAGTTGYGGVPRFDSDRFWEVVRGWERCGVPVFVSEYECPIPSRVVWERRHKSSVARATVLETTERLFRVAA
jgi:DNA adenine methylase